MSDLYLFKNTVRDLMRPGKLVAAGILIVVSIVLAAMIRANAGKGEFDPIPVYNGMSSVLVFGYMLVILSLVAATGIIVQEIEQKTIPYLLTRPMPRWRILLAKYLAAVVVTVIPLLIAETGVAITLFGIQKVGASPLWKDLLMLPIGVLSYCGIFMMAATFVPKSLMLGLAYSLIEPLLSLLPGDFNKISLLTWLHALAPHLDAGDEKVVTQTLAATPIPQWVAWIVVLSVISVTVVSALVIFSTLEYTPKEERT